MLDVNDRLRRGGADGILAAIEAEPEIFAPPMLDEPGRADLDEVRACDVRPETVEWLWWPRLAKGKLALVAGDPGAGKTWLALAIASALSRGDPLPGDSERRDPASVLYLTREDGIADTIVPRLVSLGADLTRISISRGRAGEALLTLADLSVFEKAIVASGHTFVVLDTLQSFMGAGVDYHRANETRPLVEGFADMLARTGAAGLAITHRPKAQAGRAVTAALGSIDFAAVVRTFLIAAADPDDDTQRLLAIAKSNIGPDRLAVSYRLDPARGSFGWGAEREIGASEVLQAETRKSAEDAGAVGEAEAFLLDVLAGGPRLGVKVQSEAQALGISVAAFRRARTKLGVRPVKAGMKAGWYLALPNSFGAESSEPEPNGEAVQGVIAGDEVGYF